LLLIIFFWIGKAGLIPAFFCFMAVGIWDFINSMSCKKQNNLVSKPKVKSIVNHFPAFIIGASISNQLNKDRGNFFLKKV
jgi:hypothetical protein